MSRRIVCCLFAGILLTFGPGRTPAQPDMKEADEKAHKELRELRAAVEKTVNGKDIDGLLEHVHPNVVAVWQNGETSRGHKGVREYYEKHVGGPNSTLKAYTIEPKIEELTILYGGNTGISYGTMKSRFTFRDGKTMDVEGPFSATLVKQDDKWVIASVHASVGLFENPMVGVMKTYMYWGIGIAAVVGLAVGALVMALLRRRKPAA